MSRLKSTFSAGSNCWPHSALYWRQNPWELLSPEPLRSSSDSMSTNADTRENQWLPPNA